MASPRFCLLVPSESTDPRTEPLNPVLNRPTAAVGTGGGVLLAVCLARLWCGNVIPGANTGLLTPRRGTPRWRLHGALVLHLRHATTAVSGESADEANSWKRFQKNKKNVNPEQSLQSCKSFAVIYRVTLHSNMQSTQTLKTASDLLYEVDTTFTFNSDNKEAQVSGTLVAVIFVTDLDDV